MAITTINSLAIPAGTVVSADLTYPLTGFSSTGIDDNATSTAITIDASENVGIGTTSPSYQFTVQNTGNATSAIIAGTTSQSILNLGDTSNGVVGQILYDHTTNSMRLNTAAAERMRIDSSGSILYYTGSGKGYTFGASGSSAGVANMFCPAGYTLAFGTNNTERMRITSSGNVGIGTASPSSTLHLYGTGSPIRLNIEGTTGRVESRLDNTSGAFIFGIDDSGGAGFGSAYSRNIYSNGAYPMLFWTNNAERMRIDSSGNVGIGTTSPDALLNLEATQNPVLRLGSSDGTVQVGDILGTVEFYSNDTNAPGVGAKIYAEQEDQNGAAEAAIVFETGVTGALAERMRINSDGNVGIGTSSPASLFHVKIATNENIRFNSGGSGDTRISAINDAGSATTQLSIQGDPLLFRTFGGAEMMRIDSSGSLLVGTTDDTPVSPGTLAGASIRSGGQIQASSSSDSPLYLNRFTTTGKLVGIRYAGVDVGSIDVTASATSYVTSSDYRLKENIVDAPAGNIDAIRVRSFDWKADGSHQTYGMVAQELVDVAPEAVTQGDTEDDMWGVDYSKLVPMMIKEIQDLKAEVAALKGA